MKTATEKELKRLLFDNDNMFGSLDHVQMSNKELRKALFDMPACTLHYVIIGDCLMIFSKPSQQ
jgi:hypothetical protein